MRRPTRQLALWTCTALISALLVELTLRLAAAASPAVYSAVYHHRVADDQLGWRFDSGFPDIDARGFRNERVPDRADIAVLGDSQSYGYGLPPEFSWPRQLTERAGRSTYTLAGSGYGPCHSLLLWDEALERRPGVVIEALYSGNDLYDAYHLVYDGAQLPHLQTADPDLRHELQRLERSDPLADRARHVSRLGRPVWPLRDLLRDHSRIYGLIRSFERRRGALTRSPGSTRDWTSVRQRAMGQPAYFDTYDDGLARTVLTCGKRHLAMNLGDPRLREGQRLAMAAIESLQRRAREADIEFAVLLIPTKEHVFASRIRARGAPDCEVLKELLDHEAQLWAAVQHELDELHIAWVDALPALRRALDHGDNPYHITADGHPNALGCAAIAEEVADFLTRTGI